MPKPIAQSADTDGSRLESSSSTSLFAEAVLAVLPLSIAVIPWGVLTGALAIQSGFTALQAQCLSMLVFAGAAQLSGISMVASGVPILSIFGSTMVISARHLLYSIVFRSHIANHSLLTRMTVAFVLTDEMFVVSEAHTRRTGQFSVAFALVAGFTFWVVWNLATFAGIVAGELLSNLESWGLDFAIVATFIAMTFDQLKGRPQLATVLVSGMLAVLLKPLFTDSYIVLATIGGMMTGYALSTDKDSKAHSKVEAKE